jgi:hypothetical protein
MSRFGWAYVNSEMTGAVANGPDKSIQFASGSSQKISGSSNLTFDYTTNTLYLTGTLRADTLIVSASQILKSGSTIFGDSVGDTHQFTGSVYVTGIVSSSTGIQSAGAITSQSIISSSLGFQTNATVQAAGNITSQAIISSSNGFQTNSTVEAAGNVRSTSGDLSSSVGIQTGGFLTVAGATNLKSGLTVTGSTFVQALSSSAQIQATSFAGNGLNITGIQATNVDGAGDDWSIQFKDGLTGTLTGSSNLLFSGNILSASAISASTWYGLPTSSATILGGTNTNIQFNSGSTFSGSNNFTYNYLTNNVSLTGALLMSGTSYISETDYIDFDVSASVPTYKQGRLFSDIDTGDLSYYLQYGSQKLQIGQQTVVKVKNSSGSPISKGKLVRIAGGVGDNPLIATASWENDNNSANTLGMLMSTVAHNDFGYVLLNGVLTGINTDPATFTVGQVVYLSSSGDYTATTPIAPKHTVRLGEVIRAHATVGSIFVKIDNGYEIDELHNVYISGTSEGDLLVYDNNNQYWRNTKLLSGSYIVSGSLTNLGLFSSSVGIQTAGAITSQSIISSSLGFKTNTTVEAAGNITSQGIISSSLGLQTNATVEAVGNIRTTNGDVSSSVGLQTGGFLTVSGSATIRGGLTVTGSSFVQALSSSGLIQASSLQGDGLNVTNIQGQNVNGVGDDWTVQLKDGSTGTLTGSNLLKFDASAATKTLAVVGNITAINISASTLIQAGNFAGNGNSITGIQGTNVSGIGLNGSIQYKHTTGVLTASNNLTFDNATTTLFITGTINTLTASIGVASVSGFTTLGTTYERVLLTSSIPATVTFDTSTRSTMYINNPPANFTLNFTNVSTTDQRVSAYNVVISQSSTPYSASAIQVNSTASAVKWSNAIVPAGTANRHDIYGFSLIRSGSTWVTLGQLSSFG